jgi:alkanesulfonate monooxygenase SsuD/methylene tetrahydromethanopterin reductase-like flavin-dependent oxidoreductase (luciferase family)
MQIGFGLVTCQQNPADPEKRDHAEIYRQALELAKEVEAAGLRSYWVSEHHFWDDGYQPASLPLLAGAAAVTERILLGTSILLAPFADPIRLAEDAAAVDLLSRGRLVLGLGLGWRAEEFAGFEMDPGQRVSKLKQTVATLRSAWAIDGQVGPAEVMVTPKPFRLGGPPIWFGGLAEKAVGRAAALADGFIASVPPWSLEEFSHHARTLTSAPRPLDVSVHTDVFIWDGPENPWDVVREYQWYTHWKYVDAEKSHGTRHGRTPAYPPPAPAEEHPGTLVGRPEEVLEGMRAFAPHITPGGHLIARAYFPGIPWEIQRRQVELLGQIVHELEPLIEGQTPTRPRLMH